MSSNHSRRDIDAAINCGFGAIEGFMCHQLEDRLSEVMKAIIVENFDGAFHRIQHNIPITLSLIV